ncbi:MAG: outer membrane lipoprotein-sorting protein [Balneolaceae bacterium]|nr:MAG: outer membrane lipoprotein-sorting protein [Balneolaceae bacterium]
MRSIKIISGLKIIVATILLSTVYKPALAQDAAEILDRMEQVMRGDSGYSEMTMKIVRPRYEREISMRSWHLGTDYSLILITAPARDEGIAYLMRENDIWNYDPRIDRTTRLPSSMMAQSWMGSDFTNDDLVRDTDIIRDYEHTILRTEEVDGRESYVIEMIPKPGTPIVWGKVLVWVSKDDYLQLRAENYDQRFELVNTMTLDEIKELGGRTIPSRITVTPADKQNEQTVLNYRAMEFDIDIDENFFSRANMQRVR